MGLRLMLYGEDENKQTSERYGIEVIVLYKFFNEMVTRY